ncbi:MAG: HAD family hydrolase [Planctomycetes bacterium]|nr:HAD family hydrolase [Planctomycetota bacterium]
MKAIILDRDGTINTGQNYIISLKRIRIYRDAPKALKKLQDAGYKLVVFTNQACVARGIITESLLKKINQKIIKLFRAKGVKLSRIYYCPHHPEAQILKYRKTCSCRKPATGMLRQAKRDFGIDFRKSFVIGDALKDLRAGKKVGAKTILVLTGNGRKSFKEMGSNTRKPADYIAPNLLSAAKWILGKA